MTGKEQSGLIGISLTNSDFASFIIIFRVVGFLHSYKFSSVI